MRRLRSQHKPVVGQEAADPCLETKACVAFLQQLRRRADAVAGGKPQQTSAEIPVPAAQVKGLRAALAQQADLSGEARDMADRMEAQLQRLESAAASELLVL